MSKFMPNSFQVPNAFVDLAMREAKGAATACYLLILRKTKGWNKEFDAVSLSQFIEFTGLSRATVVDAIKKLIKMDLITVEKGKRNVNVYSIKEFNNRTSSEIEPVQKLNCSSSEIEPVTSLEIEHTKDTIKNTTKNTRDIYKKPQSFKEFFELYPPNKKGGRNDPAWKKAKSLNLKDSDFKLMINDVKQRKKLMPTWYSKYAVGIGKYLSEYIWLTPITPEDNLNDSHKPNAIKNAERTVSSRHITAEDIIESARNSPHVYKQSGDAVQYDD